MNETITPEQIEILEKLFGADKTPIETDEDLIALAEIFNDED